MSSWLLLLTLLSSLSSDDASDPCDSGDRDSESGYFWDEVTDFLDDVTDFLDEVTVLPELGFAGDCRDVGGNRGVVGNVAGFGAGGKSSGFGGVGSPPKRCPRPPCLLSLLVSLLQYLGKLELYIGSVTQRYFSTGTWSMTCFADKFMLSLSSLMRLRTSLISWSFTLGISQNERGRVLDFCFGPFVLVGSPKPRCDSSNFHGTTLKNVGLVWFADNSFQFTYCCCCCCRCRWHFDFESRNKEYYRSRWDAQMDRATIKSG
jgi:hypothetical protein